MLLGCEEQHVRRLCKRRLQSTDVAVDLVVVQHVADTSAKVVYPSDQPAEQDHKLQEGRCAPVARTVPSTSRTDCSASVAMA